ncbi:unnamed protein product [Cuscuta europaea]|uniref:Retrotransposon gag protein n=1 Tax=Cuscuta europaea TaxID=41803 RepID=A0A9P1ENJ3_CUSEU|nr:unnamed protein product [Cuscuta europaea]
MINAACGGGIVNKTPSQAMNLISELAENSRYYNGRSSTRRVAAAESTPSLESQVASLTSLVKDFLLKPKNQEVKVCGICATQGHSTDSCPSLHEEQVNALNFQGHQQKRYDRHSNTYNPGWRDHPNLRYENPQQQPPQGQTSSSNMSTEDMIRALTMSVSTIQQSVAQFQETTKSSIQNLENQMSQISSVVSRLEAKDSGRLPSQTEQNPRQHVNAIMLRSGKELQAKEVEEDKVDKDEVGHNEEEPTKAKFPPLSSYEPPPPFPEALKETRKLEKDGDMYETFTKCEVNIPLLNLIKSVPRFAKFFKELCTMKRKSKLKGKQKVEVSERVSAIFQKKLPEKCSDPGMFTIPCTIGDTLFPRALLDLGASINGIPYSLYKSLNLGPMHKTGVVIQLADGSSTYPKGVIEDVLVKVENLVFPVDFYILEMGDADQTTPILLGRPFLKSAKTKIDVSSGSLTIEFDDQKVEFNIFDSTKKQIKDRSLCSLNVFEPPTLNIFVEEETKKFSIFRELEIEPKKSILKGEEPKKSPQREVKPPTIEVVTRKKIWPYEKRPRKKVEIRPNLAFENETRDVQYIRSGKYTEGQLKKKSDWVNTPTRPEQKK